MMKTRQKTTKLLIIYYGLLQSLHLLTLIRAGSLILLRNEFPFPILPPPEGWTSQTVPFMVGLGTTDVVAILLGLIFAYQALLKEKIHYLLGLLSITVFITGAIVFGAGTFPSGAWIAHPVSYWVMVVLFTPSLVLYLKLLKDYFPM